MVAIGATYVLLVLLGQLAYLADAGCSHNCWWNDHAKRDQRLEAGSFTCSYKHFFGRCYCYGPPRCGCSGGYHEYNDEECKVTETCSDGKQNQDETDVDCGGTKCDACVTETCSDGKQNQDETDVDCGGTTCDACVSVYFDKAIKTVCTEPISSVISVANDVETTKIKYEEACEENSDCSGIYDDTCDWNQPQLCKDWEEDNSCVHLQTQSSAVSFACTFNRTGGCTEWKDEENPRRLQMVKNISLEECQAVCEDDEECADFNFQPSGGVCRTFKAGCTESTSMQSRFWYECSRDYPYEYTQIASKCKSTIDDDLASGDFSAYQSRCEEVEGCVGVKDVQCDGTSFQLCEEIGHDNSCFRMKTFPMAK